MTDSVIAALFEPRYNLTLVRKKGHRIDEIDLLTSLGKMAPHRWIRNHFHTSKTFFDRVNEVNGNVPGLAKIIRLQCPQCNCESSLPFGLVDYKTGLPIAKHCPQCGFDFDFEKSRN